MILAYLGKHNFEQEKYIITEILITDALKPSRMTRFAFGIKETHVLSRCCSKFRISCVCSLYYLGFRQDVSLANTNERVSVLTIIK